MTDAIGGDNKRRAGALIRRLIAVRDHAGGGAYHDADLRSLSDCLKALAKLDTQSRQRVANVAEVSVQTVRAIETRTTQPRYYNFMRVLNAALTVADDLRGADGEDAPESVLWRAERGGWSADWVTRNDTDQLTVLREALSSLIDSLRTSNSAGADDSAINELTRKELITILETALNMLKGPMVERGFLSRTGVWVRDLGKKVLERESVGTIGEKLHDLADAIQNFLSGLS
jgi:hypothetical protein